MEASTFHEKTQCSFVWPGYHVMLSVPFFFLVRSDIEKVWPAFDSLVMSSLIAHLEGRADFRIFLINQFFEPRDRFRDRGSASVKSC